MAMARSGEVDKAVKLGETIQDNKLRVGTFISIASIARKQGDRLKANSLGARASASVQELKIPLDKVFVLADLSVSQAMEREINIARETLAKAVSIASQIVDPWSRSRALSKAAISLVIIDEI